MYYRIFDQEQQKYLSSGYNETSQTNFKEEINAMLIDDVSDGLLEKMKNAKWNEYKQILSDMALIVEESAKEMFPFTDLEESFSSIEDDLDEYGFDDDDDKWF